MAIQDNGYRGASHYRARQLRDEAKKSIEFRGHSMDSLWLEVVHPAEQNGWRSVWRYECKLCHREVSIDTRPEPNGIDIGGEAVALNCN